MLHYITLSAFQTPSIPKVTMQWCINNYVLYEILLFFTIVLSFKSCYILTICESIDCIYDELKS